MIFFWRKGNIFLARGQLYFLGGGQFYFCERDNFLEGDNYFSVRGGNNFSGRGLIILNKELLFCKCFKFLAGVVNFSVREVIFYKRGGGIKILEGSTFFIEGR